MVDLPAFLRYSPASTSSGSTISAGLRRTGRSPPGRRRPRPGTGLTGPVVSFSRPSGRRSARPANRRRPGPDHARRGSLAGRIRSAGNESPPVRLRCRSRADKDLPHRYVPHCVVYTGTHDNDTTNGWYHIDPGGYHPAPPGGEGEPAPMPCATRARRRTDPLGIDPAGLGLGRGHRRFPACKNPGAR